MLTKFLPFGHHRCAAAIGALVALFVPGTALAQAPGQISRVDTNKDGVISAAEFDAARRADFVLLDKNRNRRIERREFVASGRGDPLLRQRRLARFARIDKNRDGSLSAAEYLAFGRAQFTFLDRNRDGRLTRNEVVRRLPPAAAPGRAAGVAPPPPDLPRGAPSGSGSGTTARSAGTRAAFGAIDRDGNGVITVAELDDARRQAFRRLDANRDGRLTAAEVVVLRGRGSARRFLQMDANRDGVVTEAEFLRAGRDLLKRADRNRDGRLSADEYHGGGR